MTKPTYAELEAGNKRLRDELDAVMGQQAISQKLHHDCAKSWIELYKQGNEARYWAIYWKRRRSMNDKCEELLRVLADDTAINAKTQRLTELIKTWGLRDKFGNEDWEIWYQTFTLDVVEILAQHALAEEEKA